MRNIWINFQFKFSHLNIGAGLDWAKHVRTISEFFLSVIEDESSFELNFGLVVPTGSKLRTTNTCCMNAGWGNKGNSKIQLHHHNPELPKWWDRKCLSWAVQIDDWQSCSRQFRSIKFRWKFRKWSSDWFWEIIFTICVVWMLDTWTLLNCWLIQTYSWEEEMTGQDMTN